MSGWRAAAVDGEDLVGRAASHEVAVVAAPGVVVHEPGADLGLELAGAGEVPAVERGAPALLQGGALEAFADRVVVRRTTGSTTAPTRGWMCNLNPRTEGPRPRRPSLAGVLVWMDLEMTGLDPATDVIVEIATLVTDDQLEIVAEGPDLV